MKKRHAHVLLWLALGGLALAPGVHASAAQGPADQPAGAATLTIDQVKSKIADAGDAEKWKSDLVIVLDHEDVTVRENGLGVAREHKVTKILRDGGIRSQSVQRFPFDPHTNRLELVAIRVYRADGEVEEVSVEQRAEQPQPAWGIFWPTSQYSLGLPRLFVGDAVETITEMTGFNVAYLADDGFDNRNALGEPLQPPVPGHWHDEVHWWSSYPVIEKRYTVRLPQDKPLQFEVYNGELRSAVLMQDGHLVYTFEKENIEPFKGEPSMEATPNVGTKLLLATLPTWEDKSRWLYEVSEPHFEADDAIREKVAEITAGLDDDWEKITAMNHWVAENIRYAGTSRGMCEGYTIHPSIETFHDRCGVCKDKAGMLVTMMRVAGYDTYLTMTMARQRVDRVPADQFNHAVTVWKKPNGELVLLDPTWMPKSRDNWSTLEPDQHVVYGLPEGGGLATSDYFPPETCSAIWTSQATIEGDNRLRGTMKFTATGAPEGRLRRTIAGHHPNERDEFFQESFRRLSPLAEPTRVEAMDPIDFSGPLTIQAGYVAPGFVLGQDDKRYLKLPMLQTVFGDRTLYDILSSNNLKERKYGLKLLATRLARFEETVDLPAGWQITELPEPVEIDGPSAGLKFEVSKEPGQITYTCQLTVKKWSIPPDEYANFKEVMEKFDELTGYVVTCEVEGGHAQR